jgi:hypothetical protein
VNLVLANAFAYWKPPSDLGETFHGQMQRVESYAACERKQGVTDKIEIWTGESGWPSDGGSDNRRALRWPPRTIVAPFVSPSRTGSTYSPSRLLISKKLLCHLTETRMLTGY